MKKNTPQDLAINPSTSASQFAVRALGLKVPELPLSTKTIACGLCGAGLSAGKSPAKTYEPNPDFGAHEHTGPHRHAIICSACTLATSAASGLMTKHSRAVFSGKSAYRLSSAEDIGWMITKAEPPFMAVFNTRASSHVVWQAPITYDRRAIGIMIGQQAGVIDQPKVLNARLALARLTEVANPELQAHYQWPVINLTIYEDATDSCQMIPSHSRILHKSKDAAVAADLAAFEGLNMPERWALSALLLARPKRSNSIEDFKRPPKISAT